MPDNRDETESWVTRRLGALGVRLEEFCAEDTWRDWLAVQRRFPTYSFYNTLLIWRANPEATEVQGYKAWQRIGRQVRKGETGIRIMAPMRGRDEDGDSVIRGFRLVPVFDLAQTDPQTEIVDKRTGEVIFRGEPYMPLEWPTVPEAELPGLFESLRDVLIEREIGVALADRSTWAAPSGARGYYDRRDRTIHVGADLAPTQQLATLCHEMGHAFDPELARDEDRARRERVAESVAWLAGEELGFDKTDSTLFYLASWAADADAVAAVGKRVTRAWREVAQVIAGAHALSALEKVA